MPDSVLVAFTLVVVMIACAFVLLLMAIGAYVFAKALVMLAQARSLHAQAATIERNENSSGVVTPDEPEMKHYDQPEPLDVEGLGEMAARAVRRGRGRPAVDPIRTADENAGYAERDASMVGGTHLFAEAK